MSKTFKGSLSGIVMVLLICAILPESAVPQTRKITDRTSLVQINRALPAGTRVADTSIAQFNRQVTKRKLTDTSLVQINRAVEDE